MKKYEIKYEIVKDFLLPSKEHQEEFKKINFIKSDKQDMLTTYGQNIKLNEKILKYLIDFFKKHKLQISSVWAQKYLNGRHEAHIHSNSIFSFVWYVQADEKCSKIVFHNPGWPYVDSHRIEIQPYTGTLLMFNSLIPHEVLYNTKQVRNIISGNLSWLK